MRRHSISHDSATSAIRVASSARRGFTCRSTYNASCSLKNRFSAESCARDRPAAKTSRTRSQAMRRTVRSAERERDSAIVAGSYVMHASSSDRLKKYLNRSSEKRTAMKFSQNLPA
jgi:hypothetical protein